MPTVVFVSPKGGAGKTTAALMLSLQLARAAPVALVDADPNRPILAWGRGGHVPANLRIVSDVNEDNVLDRIEEAASSTPFVVVDLEGTAAKIVLLAISQADLVIVPTQGSQLDAEQAGRALKVIRDQERMSKRTVPYRVLLTRTNPRIRSRTLTHIEQTLGNASIQVFKTELHEREAYRAVFSFKRPLDQLDAAAVSNIDKAIANAESFAAEVLKVLREQTQEARKTQEITP